MIPDLHGKVALVTGATKGIGLACALALGRFGAHTVITYRWGSAEESDVLRAFSEVGAPAPMIIQADVAQEDDTRALMEAIGQRHAGVDIFVSNATGGALVTDVADLTERALLKTIRYGTWPMFGYLLAMKSRFGRYPRHAVAISSTGPDTFSLNYDLVAASRAALETLCRYLSHRLLSEDIRINVVRTVGVQTDAFESTFGTEAASFFRNHIPPKLTITPNDVAGTVVALCGGLLDGMRGQTLTVDRGAVFADTVARLYGATGPANTAPA
jgi:NAD(P)-dependent dehydrogenase (short-subunit alcohol dehydrogenase family)